MKTKICTLCQKTKSVSEFYKIKNTSNTTTVWYRPTCKPCTNFLNRNENGKKILNKYRTTTKGKYVYLKQSAKRRKIYCDLSFADFEELYSNSCFYCNGFFQKSEFGFSLDRVDNNKGYTLTNLVSCCYTCNSIKMDIFSQEETLAAVHAIIQVRNSKNEN